MAIELEYFDDARGYHAAVTPFAQQAETENNLVIGLSAQLVAGLLATPSPPLLVLAREAGAVVGAAFCTRPFALVLSTMADETARFIAAGLRARGESLTGVMAPERVAAAFAETWMAPAAVPPVSSALRAYRLDRVIPPPATNGHMLIASEAEAERVLAWQRAFAGEVRERATTDAEVIRRRLLAGEFAMWRDGEPVAMAGFGGPTPRGIRVNMVYTPPEFRRRGYAAALVAALSQRLLDGGRKFCFLFTDLANRTSNGVYQRIGYRPVCDFAVYRFE